MKRTGYLLEILDRFSIESGVFLFGKKNVPNLPVFGNIYVVYFEYVKKNF